jgi:hypothetical protein
MYQIKNNFPYDITVKLLSSNLKKFRMIGSEASSNKVFSTLSIIDMMDSKDSVLRIAAIKSLKNRPAFKDYIKRGLEDGEPIVRVEAAKVAVYDEFSPILLNILLNDKNYDVRKAAMETYLLLNKEFPIIRDFEPPEVVYKKCINDCYSMRTYPRRCTSKRQRILLL